MMLRDTFERSAFTLFDTAPSSMARLVYTSAVSGVDAPGLWDALERIAERDKDEDDWAFDALLESIQQAYARYQELYAGEKEWKEGRFRGSI